MTDYFAEGLDPNHAVEPWHPQIGDRVRVLMGEGCPIDTHERIWDGHEGKVIFFTDEVCGDTFPEDGHRYGVSFHPTNRNSFGFYAACELEPLTETEP